ncbi:hypothetical protein [Curtobacterium sp. VKM Ac-1393]|uniref:hypothetical protein n=1 Tax=Curtobacterium sp. VKM Ac-1393 TaxID=2783814 RepID=UPI00188AB43F|nr:hypothetical protein [Curtobacterium sp. VKM Ac-1393]MBF4606822.1 hypothetical protein [Curtobacterium sp. VKM Ac-1393]
MDTTTDQGIHDARRDRWVASSTDTAALAWVADRTATTHRHLVPVAAVGRNDGGGLVTVLDRPRGTPLSAALDRLGAPTTGVAVTLSVPLLELFVAAVDGAVRLGAAGIDDVLVDDAGAVVLCDRPVGASRDDEAPAAAATATDVDAARVVVLAARVVWERVDPRDPVRDDVDTALVLALDGDRTAARAALDVVLAAAPPRPFRWTPPRADLLFAEPEPPRSTGTVADRLLAVVRDAVEHGVPLGAGRRLPLRRVVVGIVVATGTAIAAVSTLGAGNGGS